MPDTLIKIWESYGHGTECTCWLSKKAAESHNLYAIEFVNSAKVLLAEAEMEMLNDGLPIWA